MKDFLQVAARSGSGSAARALGGGLAGMRTVTRRTVLAGAVGALLVFLGWDLFSAMSSGASSPPSDNAIATASPEVAETPQAASLPTTSTPSNGRISYAIEIEEIAGLSPHAASGTVLDIWVTWDRPLTRAPRLQRLLRRVLLEEVAPPVTPDGPYVALLSVSDRDADDLIWADRYGALSATTTSP